MRDCVESGLAKKLLESLPREALSALVSAWPLWARADQLPPEDGDPPWTTWLVLGGRGAGKTRTGAEDIAHFALWNPGVRVGVIAPTPHLPPPWRSAR